MSVFRPKETHTNGSHIPGETPHMKGVGMLVVSLRGVNSGFWSHLGCCEQNAIIFGGDEWSLRACEHCDFFSSTSRDKKFALRAASSLERTTREEQQALFIFSACSDPYGNPFFKKIKQNILKRGFI